MLQEEISRTAPTPDSHVLMRNTSSNTASVFTDLDYPALTIKRSAIEHNIRVMAEYCAAFDVELSPHGKTSMMPWLFQKQLDAGGWGLTAATPAQVRTYRALGISRILLANVLVDTAAIEWIVRDVHADSDVEFLCYVDSVESVSLLSTILSRLGKEYSLDVLIEFGYAGGRSGARSQQEVREIAVKTLESPQLHLRGISGFEGFFKIDSEPNAEDECRSYLKGLQELTDSLQVDNFFQQRPIISIGGSAYFDIALEYLAPHNFAFPTSVILRSGCYVTHDSVMYAEVSPLAGRRSDPSLAELQPALELWAKVLSLPEPGLAIVGFGRRDAPFDHSLPILLDGYREGERLRGQFAGVTSVTQLDDQHAYLQYETEGAFQVGDTLVFGISHPCGAFDKWRWVPVISDRHDIELVAGTLF